MLFDGAEVAEVFDNCCCCWLFECDEEFECWSWLSAFVVVFHFFCGTEKKEEIKIKKVELSKRNIYLIRSEFLLSTDWLTSPLCSTFTSRLMEIASSSSSHMGETRGCSDDERLTREGESAMIIYIGAQTIIAFGTAAIVKRREARLIKVIKRLSLT